MTPAAAADELDRLIHAWLLDVESWPYPIIQPPKGQNP